MAKQVWQRHHVTYKPEWTVPVTKGEHWAITYLSRFGSLSEGAKTALNYILATKPTRATPEGK